MPQFEIDSLRKLTASARSEFGEAVFWSLPVLVDPVDEARNVGRALSKHGGLKGLRLAGQIEHALITAGLASWR